GCVFAGARHGATGHPAFDLEQLSSRTHVLRKTSATIKDSKRGGFVFLFCRGRSGSAFAPCTHSFYGPCFRCILDQGLVGPRTARKRNGRSQEGPRPSCILFIFASILRGSGKG